MNTYLITLNTYDRKTVSLKTSMNFTDLLCEIKNNTFITLDKTAYQCQHILWVEKK